MNELAAQLSVEAMTANTAIFENIFQGVIDAPDLQSLPATRNLVIYTLCAIKDMFPRSSAGDFGRIHYAHKEITALHPSIVLSFDEPAKLTHDGGTDVDSPLEHLMYLFIATSLQSGASDSDKGCLEFMLGYEFNVKFQGHPYNPHDASDVHIQRAREIMGPSVTECMDMCGGFGARLVAFLSCPRNRSWECLGICQAAMCSQASS
jgi:hypothetical protein